MTEHHATGAPPCAGAPEELWDERQFRSLVANVPGAVYRFDPSGWKVHFVSAGIERICGYPGSDFLGPKPKHTFAGILHPDDHDWCELHILDCIDRGEPWDVEFRIIHADGSVRWAHERGRAVYDANGTPLFLDGAIFDITERKRLEQQLQHLAYHDSLTGLANRSLFQQHVERALAQADREHGAVVVLFIDLDNFKQVNDTFGHAAGDDVLRRVFLAIESCLREGDFAARLGGDEFALILPHTGMIAAAKIAERLLAAIRLAGGAESLTATVGVAPLDEGPRRAMLEADLALYRAKAEGRDSIGVAEHG